MARLGLYIACCLLVACNSGDDQNERETIPSSFSKQFKAANLPYQLYDTALLNNDDTVTIREKTILYIPDSTQKQIFGSAKNIRLTPLVKLEQKGEENYYLVKAWSDRKKAALLFVLDASNNYRATLPFLVPDEKKETTQHSVIDESLVITKSIVERETGDVAAEGKEVLAYDPADKQFHLIMTDILNEESSEAINPIDTFKKTHPLAGDYYMNKKNLVAVRDGRYNNQLLVYMHTENKAGDCSGEFKGEFVVVDSKTAIYQQGGDPCALELKFSGNSVTVSEIKGCGNYRGLDCPLGGTFRKRPSSKK